MKICNDVDIRCLNMISDVRNKETYDEIHGTFICRTGIERKDIEDEV